MPDPTVFDKTQLTWGDLAAAEGEKNGDATSQTICPAVGPAEEQ